jgi:hypothetical protein
MTIMSQSSSTFFPLFSWFQGVSPTSSLTSTFKWKGNEKRGEERKKEGIKWKTEPIMEIAKHSQKFLLDFCLSLIVQNCVTSPSPTVKPANTAF